MSKWEYSVESVTVNEKWSEQKQLKELKTLEQNLNNMGQDGWEMISYESVPLLGRFSGNLKGYAYLIFFKRKIN